MLRRYFESVQHEKQLPELLFTLGLFKTSMRQLLDPFRYPDQDPGAIAPLGRFAQQRKKQS